LFATIIGVMRSIIANLTPASGRQDHTTSPSARLHARQSRHSRPSHPDPTFVTIAKRPFVWVGIARDMQVIWVKSEPEYFCGKDWTTQIRLNPKRNFFSAVTRNRRRKSAVKGAD
jgi:hypothetical protein